MRAFDRDLIRAGHYGQRSWVPHSKAEHMAAPTKGCDVKILLANPEPSTHGPKRTCWPTAPRSGFEGRADLPWAAPPCLLLTQSGRVGRRHSLVRCQPSGRPARKILALAPL